MLFHTDVRRIEIVLDGVEGTLSEKHYRFSRAFHACSALLVLTGLKGLWMTVGAAAIEWVPIYEFRAHDPQARHRFTYEQLAQVMGDFSRTVSSIQRSLSYTMSIPVEDITWQSGRVHGVTHFRERRPRFYEVNHELALSHFEWVEVHRPRIEVDYLRYRVKRNLDTFLPTEDLYEYRPEEGFILRSEHSILDEE